MAATGIIDEMRRGFSRSTMLMKLVWINIAVFVLLRITAIVCMFAGTPGFLEEVMRQVQLPSHLSTLATRPWTVITYMFSTPRQMLALYIYGGLGGAVMFLLAYNLIPTFAYTHGWLIGSSASVIAIVTATAILMPDFRMHLLFIGSVSLKWIAIATIGLVLIGVTGSNAGGEFAHIGGVIVGAWYGLMMKRGQDITRPLNRLFDMFVNGWHSITSIRLRNKTPESSYKYQSSSASSPSIDDDDRAQLDEILDKIKKSGYAALTPEERKRLFDVSRRMK